MHIYHIRNIVNEKRYVGQTIQKNPQKRWWYHRHQLRKGIHMSPYLQNAWNKYGEDTFIFDVVAWAGSPNELNELETKEISKWKKEKLCYNITDGGDNVRMSVESKLKLSKSLIEYHCKNGKLWPELVSPEGLVYSDVRNLTDFCRQHNLRRDRIKDVYRKKIGQHRGWTVVENSFKRNNNRTQGAKSWDVITPMGEELEISNLKRFCEDNDLNYQALKAQHYGYSRSKKYKNWTVIGRKNE